MTISNSQSPSVIGTNDIGPIFLSTIATAVKRLTTMGLDCERLLASTGLSVDMLDTEVSNTDLVCASLLLKVYENAMDISDDPALGLRYGETSDVTVYGPMGFAMVSAATDIEAVNLALKYQRIHFGNIAQLSLLLENGHGVIRVSDSLPACRARRFFVEMLLSGFLSFNEVMAGKPARLNEMRFAYPDPGYPDHYERLFKCPVLFDAPYHEIVFDTGILAHELPNANRMTFIACEKICADLLEKFNRGEQLSLQVRRLLRERFHELRDMKSVADCLQFDERTLRRKLRSENTSFQCIKDEVRRETAIDYLRSTQMSVREIALRIGFDEPSNFRRAFRRWTGSHPGYYRV